MSPGTNAPSPARARPHDPIRQFHALLTREHVPDLRSRMLMLKRQGIDRRTEIRLGDDHFVARC